MTTRKLVKKYELYVKLNGGLDQQNLKVTDCSKCILSGMCDPPFLRRYAFIKMLEGEPPKIIGYGNDFGMKGYVEDDKGKIIFKLVKACMEWLDPDPRIFEK